MKKKPEKTVRQKALKKIAKPCQKKTGKTDVADRPLTTKQEKFCIAQVETGNGRYELFHYRDREKREIDFLIEREDGHLLGIEIKAGSAVHKNDFKHLLWFKHKIAKNNEFIGIILYTGEHPVSFGPNLWAVPMGHLWS